MSASEATITAVFDPVSPTAGIQEAIDALGKRGGCVRVPAGEWPLRASVVLSSRVELIGDGAATELTAAPAKALLLSRDARKGARSVHVRGKVPFAPGDAVRIEDEKRRWEDGTNAIVTAVEGRTIRFDGPIVRGLKTELNARIASIFPGITTPGLGPCKTRTPVWDAGLRDLSLRGAASAEYPFWEYSYNALHLPNFNRSHITRLSIYNWPSEGIGVQGGEGAQITHCQIHDCIGGFHVGGGTRRSVWSHNVATGNRGDGLFFCWRVHDSVISDNVFAGNGCGIGGLTYGDDHHNVIGNNVCSENGHSGIVVDNLGVHPNANEKERGGYIITGNMLRNNSQAEPGEWPALRLHNAHRFLVQGNSCADDQRKPTQTKGIVESGDSDWNLISGNMCVGMEEGVTVIGPNSRAEGNMI